MTNIHPLPKRRTVSRPTKRHTHKLDHSAAPFHLPSVQGEKVDVLITVIAGCNVFLAADLVSAEDEPTGNFHRALEGYETLLLAADTIIQFGMTEGAIDLRNSVPMYSPMKIVPGTQVQKFRRVGFHVCYFDVSHVYWRYKVRRIFSLHGITTHYECTYSQWGCPEIQFCDGC